MDFIMNASQAPQALPARAHSDQPAAAPDAQLDLPLDEGAGVSAQVATPQPAPPQEPRMTVEDMSGWAMGGSSVSD
jgi:hypothetical protein